MRGRRRHRRAGSAAALLAVFCAGCQDTARPGSADAGLSDVSLTYVCGNSFSLRNRSFQSVTLHYAVLGTSEEGDLLLPAGPDSSRGSVRLITLHSGPVQVMSGESHGDAVDNGAVSCPAPAWRLRPEAEAGQWAAPIPWPHVAVHLHLLPDGRILSWGRIGLPTIYEPATGSFRDIPSSTMLFCAGHTFTASGNLLVAGGHLDDRKGLRDANLFDIQSGTWRRLPDMGHARWYPTTTLLPDGEVVTLAGTDESGNQVETPELWDGAAWRPLTGAVRSLPYYPRTFVAPNGLVFYAGELAQSAYLDPAGEGQWIPVAVSRYGRRDYGSAVMYQPGKVLIVGGSDPPDGKPTATAEVIDLNVPAPVWSYTGSMAFPRRHLNATVLPDGDVLVTGGTSSAGFSDPSGSVHQAELWNPGDQQWKVLAANRVNRVYHSTALLLPDGRVLHAGSGDGPGLPRELTAELFSPPYLFRGPRPTLADAPAAIGFGQTFFLATAEAGEVLRVTLVRLGSVTHAFDQSQRFVELAFTRAAGGLSVRGPESAAVAPPGPYLLSVVNGDGVPSISRSVLLH